MTLTLVLREEMKDAMNVDPHEESDQRVLHAMTTIVMKDVMRGLGMTIDVKTEAMKHLLSVKLIT
jgi:hypothetical protein